MARFCTQCGSPLADGMAFCTQCGTPVQTVPENAQAPAEASAATQVPADTSTEQPAVQPADTTVVLGQAAATQVVDQVYDTQAPVSQSPAYQAPMTQGQTAQMPMSQAPLIQTPVIQSPGAGMPGVNGQQTQQPKKSKAPLIIGIVIALIVIAAAVVVGFFVLNQDASSTDSNASAESSASDNPSTETKPVECKVTFNTNGGSEISPVTVNKGETVSAPKAPTRASYTFAGWYSDSSLKTAVSFPLTVESDTTLYAKWDNPKNASEVTLTVVGKDGTTKTATIHRDGQTGRIFPDSNTVALTDSQVNALSDAERCIARNEIIAAANGYEFKNSGLKNYFTNYCTWYKPVSGSDGSTNLSSTAIKNIDLLKAKTDSWWLNLATN